VLRVDLALAAGADTAAAGTALSGLTVALTASDLDAAAFLAGADFLLADFAGLFTALSALTAAGLLALAVLAAALGAEVFAALDGTGATRLVSASRFVGLGAALALDFVSLASALVPTDFESRFAIAISYSWVNYRSQT
jgi:hypothetical protein